MRLIRFLASTRGRLLRVVLGLAMVGVGTALAVGSASAWWILAVVGLAPMLAGAFGVCLLGPLFREPFRSRHGVTVGS